MVSLTKLIPYIFLVSTNLNLAFGFMRGERERKKDGVIVINVQHLCTCKHSSDRRKNMSSSHQKRTHTNTRRNYYSVLFFFLNFTSYMKN